MPTRVQVPFRGQTLLNQSLLNKDTAFTREERAAFGLDGLLPPKVSSIDQQVQRAYEEIGRKADPLERHIGLLAIQDRNEHLFYRLLIDHVEEFLPIIYTPTVGLACQQFSHIYRRPRGMWITPDHRGRMEQVLNNATSKDVRLIVVTDNDRILGLGDLGAGGIGIPIGKLTLYTAAAGIHPRQTLPVSLDVGTDNAQLLQDDLYIGWRHPRLRGQEYFDLVEEFVVAVRRCFPKAILQWEDFKKQNAFALLDRYRDRLPSFNDDIQGTAAVAVAVMLSASRRCRLPIPQQRVVILGAGGAGIGIARQLKSLLQRNGVFGRELTRSIAVLDSVGLLHEGRPLQELTKREVAWPVEMVEAAGLATDPPADLLSVVRALRPTTLIGVSGEANAFSEEVVRTMAEFVDHPVILPLSNPNSRSEARPSDLIAWTSGRAVVATGSPFDPVEWQGRTIRIGQANNIYVFPGIGLGAMVAGASCITDSLFSHAAETLAAQVTDADRSSGDLLPRLSNLRKVTASVAETVVRQAIAEGLAPPLQAPSIPEAVAAAMWTPEYSEYVPLEV